MSKPKTQVAIILDRSGSMSSIRQQAVQNYNEQIQQMKENSKDQDIFCSLVTFNGNVFEHIWQKKAEELEEADENSFIPGGSTALWDGMGFTIQKLLDTTEDDENTAYLVIVISDGEENQSKNYNSASIKALIEKCQATNRWTFSYMGCSEEYLHKIAEQTSIPISNMAQWSNKSAEAMQFATASSLTRNSHYYGERARGRITTSCLMSDSASAPANYTNFSPNCVSTSDVAPIITNFTSINTSNSVDVCNPIVPEKKKCNVNRDIFSAGKVVS